MNHLFFDFKRENFEQERPVTSGHGRRKPAEQQSNKLFDQEQSPSGGRKPGQNLNLDLQEQTKTQKPLTAQLKKRSFIVQSNSRPYTAKAYFFKSYSSERFKIKFVRAQLKSATSQGKFVFSTSSNQIGGQDGRKALNQFSSTPLMNA